MFHWLLGDLVGVIHLGIRMHIQQVAILRFSRPPAFKGVEWGGLGLRYLTQVRAPMSEYLLVRLLSHLLIRVSEI